MNFLNYHFLFYIHKNNSIRKKWHFQSIFNLLSISNMQETVGIIQLLDPEGKGKVSFKDFCQGVQQILEVQGQYEMSYSIHNYLEMNCCSMQKVVSRAFCFCVCVSHLVVHAKTWGLLFCCLFICP